MMATATDTQAPDIAPFLREAKRRPTMNDLAVVIAMKGLEDDVTQLARFSSIYAYFAMEMARTETLADGRRVLIMDAKDGDCVGYAIADLRDRAHALLAKWHAAHDAGAGLPPEPAEEDALLVRLSGQLKGDIAHRERIRKQSAPHPEDVAYADKSVRTSAHEIVQTSARSIVGLKAKSRAWGALPAIGPDAQGSESARERLALSILTDLEAMEA